MWRLGCRKKKKKVTYKDPESLIERVVVVQPGKEVELPKKTLSGQAHSITTDTTDTVEVITEKV